QLEVSEITGYQSIFLIWLIVYSFKVRKRLVVLESLDDLYQAMYF
ncbi:unnamed protein product, partial [Brassica rapa]